MILSRYFRQGILLVFVVGPLVATAYAMISLWHQMIGWRELALFFGLYAATGIGVTFGYHRMLTHRSFETGPVLKSIALILAAMASES